MHFLRIEIVNGHSTVINHSKFNIDKVIYHPKSNFLHWLIFFLLQKQDTICSQVPHLIFTYQLTSTNLKHFHDFCCCFNVDFLKEYSILLFNGKFLIIVLAGVWHCIGDFVSFSRCYSWRCKMSLYALVVILIFDHLIKVLAQFATV